MPCLPAIDDRLGAYECRWHEKSRGLACLRPNAVLLDTMPKILLLDDDATFLNAVSALIMAARTDIAIDTALCAEAGLLLIGISDYDAIISDFRMSGLDGLRLVQECKRLRPGTPVVLITGYGDRNLETEALHLGAYAFIHKPVQPDVLLSLVDRAVRKVDGRRSCESHEVETLTGSRIECHRLLAKVQEINRLIQQHLESLGNDTVH
jgi:DNA-binding NtrC family response regulator